jgi:hypothetical protein
MNNKVCKNCKIQKDLDSFYKNKKNKDNLQSSCKQCTNQAANLWRINNPEKIKINKKKYYEKHSVKNKEKIKKYNCDWRRKNKDKTSEYNKKWLLKNSEYQKEYRDKNKEYIKNQLQNRLNNDPDFKLKHSIRTLIRGSFKRACKGVYKKGSKTENILGCDLYYFIEYISSKFTKDMSLNNHGEWHLDHIIPVSSAKTKDEIIKLNHYTNFQPLWAIDNLKKGSKIIK